VQFGASGGVARMTLGAEQHLLALVQAFANPRLPPSCCLVARKRVTASKQTFSAYFDFARLYSFAL